MLAKSTSLTLTRPTQDSSPESTFKICTTVNSIGEFGAISQYVKKRQYKDMIELLNQDWEIKPNQRYIAARALIGSVIIDTENHRGLLILTLEVYGRDPDIDSHAEQRSSNGSTRQSTSVPSLGHNDFEIRTMNQTEGNNTSIKLVLGIYPFNALVTASVRIDNLVDQPECGPNTVNFVMPPQNHLKYKLFLDSQSWSDSLKLDEKTNINSIYTHSRLMQLRQLKSRFHEIDTYSSSRSSLFHGHLQQPVTVFTYVSEFKKETKAKLVLTRILQLFDDGDNIPIFGNTQLNGLVEELANMLAPYLSTTNKKSVIPSLTDHLKSY
ncbi:unnamed protein product [Mucor hiemalis]